MNLQHKKKVLAVALSCLLLVTACPINKKNESKARTLLRASDDIAQGQIEAANFLVSARDTGVLTSEDIQVIKAILIDINGYNQKAIEYGKELLKQDPIPVEGQERLLQLVYQASNAITRLNNAGLTRIKDPAKRAAFNAIVLAFQAAVTSVITVLVKKGS